MIVWQGFGFLAAAIPVAFMFLLAMIERNYSLTYANEAMLIISAVTVWFIGKKLNDAPGKVLIDPKTNQEVLIKNRHTLFWIPMEWYGILLGVLAAIVFSKHFA